MQKVFLKVLLGTVLLGNMPTHSRLHAEEILEDIPQIEITEKAVPTDYNIVKSDNVRADWTDYWNYAQPNEEGYAYYIHTDTDISSEIFTLDENSSEDVLLFTFD